MKKLFKTLAALAVVAALAFGFASCGSGDDDNSSGGGGGNVNYFAKYESKKSGDNYEEIDTFTFFKDGKFEYTEESTITGSSGHSHHEITTDAAGTYTLDSGDWENGTVTLKATSGDDASYWSGTYTIKDKVLTANYNEFKATYTSEVKSDSKKDDESGNSGKEPSQTEKKLLAEYNYDNLSLISFYSNNTFEFKYSDSDYIKESGTYSLVGNWNNGCVAIKNSSTSNYPKIESGVHVISDGVVKISYYDYSVKEIASGADKNVFPEMVYFPDNEEYSEKKIVNLFIKNDETSESNKIYLGKIATFFFSDNTWLSTEKRDSASGIQTSVLNTGTYTGEINRSYSDITLSSAGAPSASTYTLEKDNFGRVILRKSFIREYRFDADVFASKEKYINYDKINAIFDAPEKKGDNYTKEKLYVFYKYDSSSGKSLYEVLSIITAGDYTNIEVLESSTYSLSSGDWFDGNIKFSDGYFGNEIKDRVMTIGDVKYTRSYPEYKDTTAANGSAAFAATILGRKYVVKFDNGTYVQYCNGQEEAKGTYTMTGDFTNGTMRLNENQEYKNGSWKTKSEIINCTITNGTLKNTYGSFTAVSSDYDVSQDSSTSTESDDYYESSFGESAVAVFRYKDSVGYETIYFYSDGTWKCREYTLGFYRNTDYTGKWSRTSGNWTNGVISFTAETHNERTANFGTIPLTITNGKFKMKILDTPSIESTDYSPEYIKR